MGNRSCKLEGVVFFLWAEAEGVESNIGELQFLGIVDGIYLDLSLRKAATNKVNNLLMKLMFRTYKK